MFRNALVPLSLLLTFLSSIAWAHSPASPPVSAVTITRGSPNFGGPFSLIDQNGKPRSSMDFRGTPMLIYFGYTNCTDACPLDSQVITDVVDLLDKRGMTVAPIFVTVDPQRDTAARLKEYLAAFHPRFVGLTGPVARVMQVTTAYGASGEGDQVNAKSNGSYDVLHVAVAYLMGRNGEFFDIVRLKDPPAAIAAAIAETVNKADRPHQ